MKETLYKIHADRTVTTETREVSDDELATDPLYQAAKAFAEAHPGRMVYGCEAAKENGTTRSVGLLE
jgi:hypothetical protein